MDNFYSTDRYLRIYLISFFIANAIVLFSVEFLPFIDLPNHLAEATIYKFYGEPGSIISHYYQPTPWFFPNTFHPVFCSIFPSVELGNSIFHLFYIVLLQLALWLAIRELNGNPWYGMLGLLFTFNYNVTYGFVGFAISIPTLILLFYVILKDIHSEKLILKIVTAALLVILFLMHAQNALLGLVLFGFMTLYKYHRSIKSILIRGLLIPLPLLLMIFAWWFTRESEKEGSTLDFLLNYYQTEYFQNFGLRFRIFVLDNFQLFEGLQGIVIAIAIVAAVILPLLFFKIWNIVTRHELTHNVVFALILFTATFLCYLFLPDKLPGQTPLFQRFCTIVILSFVILMSVLLKNIQSKTLPFYVMICSVLYLSLWFHYIIDFNQQNSQFNSQFFKQTKSGALVGLIYDNKFRGRKVYIHFPNYFLVWQKGVVASKIIDYRFGVVRRVATEAQIPFYDELIGEGYRYHPEYSNLDYVLVRGEAPVQPDKNLLHFKLINVVGLWKLYGRR
jgi:hypothetical protein